MSNPSRPPFFGCVLNALGYSVPRHGRTKHMYRKKRLCLQGGYYVARFSYVDFGSAPPSVFNLFITSETLG